MTTTIDLQKIITQLEKYFQLQTLNTKPVLTFDEAVLYTGISKSTLQKYTSGRKIPYHKQGRFVYFCRQQLDNWMLQHPIKTAAQLDMEAATYAALNPLNQSRRRSAA